MHIWLLLWICVAAAEALLYVLVELPVFKSTTVRVITGTLVAVAVVMTAALILTTDWKAWIAPVFVTPYRLVNIVRFMRYRLQRDRLRDVSLRAHVWLVAMQLILFGISHFVESQPVVTIASIIAAFQLLVVLVLLRSTVQTWEYAKPVEPEKHYSDKDLPSVSLLIPARDETETLQRCLEGAIQSDYPKLEIIVLDDCSQGQKTSQIIRSFAQDGVRFVQGEAPEKHWVAKNFACEQLRNEASGSLLLFASADVRFKPETIRAMVEHMLTGKKDMLSMLPTLAAETRMRFSFLQPMRYYWELCLPRRMFKRPPTLSTCWMISAEKLEQYGGFASARQSITPETHFARKAVIADGYSFVRSSAHLSVQRAKDPASQYETTVRMRYPQLHRRLELVATTSLFELVFIAGPFVGVALSFFLPYTLAFLLVWLASVLTIEVMYNYVSVQTRLNGPLTALVTAPFAILLDVYMLHVSLLRYEFGNVDWRGRNVCIPVMQVEPRRPRFLKASARSV